MGEGWWERGSGRGGFFIPVGDKWVRRVTWDGRSWGGGRMILSTLSEVGRIGRSWGSGRGGSLTPSGVSSVSRIT